MTTNKRVILAGDMNGHAGTDRSGVERWHGDHGYDSQNDEGSTILRCTRCVIWQSSKPRTGLFPNMQLTTLNCLAKLINESIPQSLD